MANVFSDILTNGIRQGQVPSRSQAAREWYRKQAQGIGKRINERRFVNSDTTRLVKTIRPGEMYMYLYDPKYKDTLPFYDRFPLIFPFRVEGGRFWGINLHYLPHNYRALLMDSLYEITTNNRYDESTKLRISYDILNSSSKFRYFKPCVKQYLFEHLQSQFIYIYPSEWDIALMLPLERFTKASKPQVWSNSRQIIAG